jgi:Domain of unknown function (DUF4111)
VESLRWHEESGEPLGDDSVLNACRALRWARTGEWTSKPEAGRWALDTRAADVATVAAALAARTGGPPVAPDRAAELVASVRAAIGES